MTHAVAPAARVDHDGVRSLIVSAIDDDPGRAGLPHFHDGEFLLALHGSMVAPAPGGETTAKSWSRGGVGTLDTARFYVVPRQFVPRNCTPRAGKTASCMGSRSGSEVRNASERSGLRRCRACRSATPQPIRASASPPLRPFARRPGCRTWLTPVHHMTVPGDLKRHAAADGEVRQLSPNLFD